MFLLDMIKIKGHNLASQSDSRVTPSLFRLPHRFPSALIIHYSSLPHYHVKVNSHWPSKYTISTRGWDFPA